MEDQPQKSEHKAKMLLTIFSLNCWGILGVSKDRQARIQAIGEELASGSYDVALLQEVWLDADFYKIKSLASGVLPFAHYFHSGVIGSGLCVFSRYPIVDSFYHQWAVNGYFHKVYHGDWFGGKGVGYCQILTPEGLRINTYTSHLHADYGSTHDEYLAHRFLQAFDASQMVRHTRHAADITVLAGDLNSDPSSAAYKMIVHNGGLTDAFVAVHGERSDHFGQTNDTPDNSYTPKRLIRRGEQGKRIDYVMYSCSDEHKITALSCDMPLPQRVPGEKFSYSDHDAVVARLNVERRDVAKPTRFNVSARAEVLRQGITICNQALNELRVHRLFYMQFFTLALLLGGTLFIFVTLPVWANLLVHGFLGTVALFLLYMGTIWNMMETNGILAGVESMEVLLTALENKQTF